MIRGEKGQIKIVGLIETYVEKFRYYEIWLFGGDALKTFGFKRERDPKNKIKISNPEIIRLDSYIITLYWGFIKNLTR